MGTSTLIRGAIAVIVVVLAAIIIYPKLMGSKNVTGQSTSQDAYSQQASKNQTLKQSWGEIELAAALKSGKPTMILFHSTV